MLKIVRWVTVLLAANDLTAAQFNPAAVTSAKAADLSSSAMESVGISMLNTSAVPVVTIHTIDSEALEVQTDSGMTNPPNLGVVEFRRTGDATTDLGVLINVSGTAQIQSDYVLLPGISTLSEGTNPPTLQGQDQWITIPAGATSYPLAVQALSDLIFEADETVIITLLEDPRDIDPPYYRPGTPHQAIVYVVEYSGAQKLMMFTMGDGQLQFVLPEGSLVQGQLELEFSHDLIHWQSLGPFSPGDVAAFAQDTVPPDTLLPRFYRSALRR